MFQTPRLTLDEQPRRTLIGRRVIWRCLADDRQPNTLLFRGYFSRTKNTSPETKYNFTY